MIPSYCITMSITPERYTRAKNLFNDLKYPVNFYIAERDPQGGIYGCWRSHLACWDDAVSKGHDIIAVFEDDVEIPNEEEFKKILEEAHKFLVQNENFEFIALHGQVLPIEYKKGPIKFGVPITTCAYMIHLPRFLKRGRKNIEPTGKHFDYELFLNPEGPIYTKAGVFDPVVGILPGSDFGTINDYGPLLNISFKIFGYSKFTNIRDVYIKILRFFPRIVARRFFLNFNERLVKLLQPTF